jgi:polysaccharide export outer membrane protein
VVELSSLFCRIKATRVACQSYVALLLVLTTLAACSLPAAAPTAIELQATPTADSDFNYASVKIDARVVATLDQFRPTFGPGFRTGRYVATNAVRAGDVIAITVYETGGQTLFPPPSVVAGAAASASQVGAVATGASNIPPQMVETDGTIFVPFVGRVKVAGLTPGQAGAAIEKDLQGKAVAPQVLVSVVNNIGNAATVGGEVNSARSVPLGSRGERLLDVISAAGGAKYPAYETYVQVIRGGQVANVLLQTIINNPKENITVRPHDQIYVTRNERTYTVLGATQKVASYSFGREKITLAEAIAQAGGPIDTSGDLTGIYLFRFEPWYIAKDVADADFIKKLGENPPKFVPVLYQINLKDAQSYFLAQAVQMRDKDVLLVPNSSATQLGKLLAIVRGFTGVAYDLKRQTVN